MWKALIKLQLKSYIGALSRNTKTGKRHSPLVLIGIALLAIYLVAVFAGMFFGLGYLLAEPFAQMGILWFYFMLGGILATLLGVFGSVFFAKSFIFEAKDNESLLAMPIPTIYILLSRLMVLYVQALLFEALVLIPLYVAYFRIAAPTFGMVVGMTLMLLTLPLLAVTLTCLLARLIAFLSARIKNKGLTSLFTVVAVLVIYYPIYFGIMDYIEMLLLNAPHLAELVKTNVYPLYALGAAFAGNGVFILVMTAILLALGAFCIWYMERCFLAVATTRRGFAKRKTATKSAGLRSTARALLLRELRRIWNCPIYLINSAFGGIFAIIGGVAIVVMGGKVEEALMMFPEIAEMLALCLLGMVVFLNSISTTAPSVSLEGKTLWVLQTSPAPTEQVLWAKTALHLLINGVPSLLFIVVACIALQIPLTTSILLVAATVLTTLFTGLAGLLCNLLLPKLEWANEAVPVKQGMSVLLAMLVNYTLILAGVLVVIFTEIDPVVFIILFNTLLLALVLACVYLLKGWGCRRFANLH